MNTKIIENILFVLTPFAILIAIRTLFVTPIVGETIGAPLGAYTGTFIFATTPLWIALFLRKRRKQKEKQNKTSDI